MQSTCAVLPYLLASFTLLIQYLKKYRYNQIYLRKIVSSHKSRTLNLDTKFWLKKCVNYASKYGILSFVSGPALQYFSTLSRKRLDCCEKFMEHTICCYYYYYYYYFLYNFFIKYFTVQEEVIEM